MHSRHIWAQNPQFCEFLSAVFKVSPWAPRGCRGCEWVTVGDRGWPPKILILWCIWTQNWSLNRKCKVQIFDLGLRLAVRAEKVPKMAIFYSFPALTAKRSPKSKICTLRFRFSARFRVEIRNKIKILGGHPRSPTVTHFTHGVPTVTPVTPHSGKLVDLRAHSRSKQKQT